MSQNIELMYYNKRFMFVNLKGFFPSAGCEYQPSVRFYEIIFTKLRYDLGRTEKNQMVDLK